MFRLPWPRDFTPDYEIAGIDKAITVAIGAGARSDDVAEAVLPRSIVLRSNTEIVIIVAGRRRSTNRLYDIECVADRGTVDRVRRAS